MGEELVDEPKAKSGSKKIILFVVLALVLLGGGVVAAYMSGMLGTDDAHDEPAKVEAPPPSGVSNPATSSEKSAPTKRASPHRPRSRPKSTRPSRRVESRS